MANDNGGVHSPKWRTHTPVRMVTANHVAVEKRAYVIVGYSAADKETRRETLGDHLVDAGYIEVAANLDLDTADNPVVERSMRRSHYFHFTGHGSHIPDRTCTHWMSVACNSPKVLGIPYSTAATLGSWCGRMRHMHVQGCSTAVGCQGSPCFGSTAHPSIADYVLQMGAQSSAGARQGLASHEAVPWMDAFYGYVNERDSDGKFIRDIWGAIQDAADKMDRDYPDTSYGRILRQGVMVPVIKYIGPRNILIAPR